MGLSDDEQWLIDRKELDPLQIRSKRGDFSFSLYERACEYTRIRLERRKLRAQEAARERAPTATKQTPADQATPAAKQAPDDRATKQLDEPVARPATRPAGLTLASSRPRTLFRLAILHNEASCTGADVRAHAISSAGRIALPEESPPVPRRSRRSPSRRVAGMKFRPHHLLLNFLDFIGVDRADPLAVKRVVANDSLRNAVSFEGANYAAELFFELLRSQKACYWEVDTLEAVGKKILGQLRVRHVRFADLARETGLSRTTIRAVETSPNIRMATLIAIGRPAGFLNGQFSTG